MKCEPCWSPKGHGVLFLDDDINPLAWVAARPPGGFHRHWPGALNCGQGAQPWHQGTADAETCGTLSLQQALQPRPCK